MVSIDSNVVDGIATFVGDDGEEKLALLIKDKMEWKEEDKHIELLQEKINAYLGFIESKQYQETYEGKDFSDVTIELHFKHGVTDKCMKFLQYAAEQIKEEKIFLSIYDENI